MREHGYKSSKYRKEVSRKCCILVFSKKRIPPHLSLTAIDGVSCSIIMNKFEARSTLGSEAVPVFDDDGELTEWLHRDNYTVEELELMNFVGNEKPVIKKDGVKIIRDGTVIRRTNTETRKTEFLFIPRIVVGEQKNV